MIDLHWNSNFLIKFYMIHTRDVIKISRKEVGQKAKSNHISKLEKVFDFLDSFPANYHKKWMFRLQCFVCNAKNYQIVRKLPRTLIHLSNHISEVHERKLPKFSQINLLTIADVSFIILIMFIISVITWYNVYENNPIDWGNFFCELVVYVTCDTSN